MFYRMTIWTQNYQIIHFIIFMISVFMMNTQYFYIFIKTAFFTFINHIPSFHKSSQSGSIFCCFRFRFKMNAYTFSRTIFSFFRRGIFKFFTTIFTYKCFSTIPKFKFCFVITCSRAIFSFISSTRYMRKFFITNKTISSYLNCAKFIFAFSRTVFCCFNSVFGNIKFFITSQTFYNFSTTRFIHATY